MNHIEIVEVETAFGYQERWWFIDGKPLYAYLNQWTEEYENDTTVRMMKPFENLCPAWTKELDWYGDVRFVWRLIGEEKANLPILLCPEDLDFSCIVVVVEVVKTGDFVYWKRIGCVNHERESFAEEKESGILKLEAYTDKDWERYGDNIATAVVDSEEWRDWISGNWEEELYRRRMNYTHPYWKTEGNINWLHETDWCFDRAVYEKMTDLYWELETLSQLEKYTSEKKMSVKDCAVFISRLSRTGTEDLREHLEDYGEILLHLFASEQISEPLIMLLKSGCAQDRRVSIYSRAVEIMWKYGEDSVVNVVDVTLLERLSDDADVWRRFGTVISDAFKQYINTEVLVYNLMMGGVERLE